MQFIVFPLALKPFLSINCRALNEQRFQAEVFGIDADETIGPSLLEQADGGTVLFNDILTISKDQQMNLLRFQEGIIETLNGPKHVDVHILAANSSDVEKALTMAILMKSFITISMCCVLTCQV